MKFISLFAGIGGFDLALTRNGHECVFANEWDKYASQIYENNFGTKPNIKDIRTVGAEEIPDHDILVGGFPCQAFSIAGKRNGFSDTRGTLFFEIARILNAKRPCYFILENVKGLLSHDEGRTFGTIISALDELGYDLQWQVLNSKDFGVSQNRERVYIIGNLRGETRPQIFPIKESPGSVGAEIKRIAHNEKFIRYNQTYDASGSVEALDTSGGGGYQPCIIYHGRLKATKDESNCLDSNYFKGPDNHGQRTVVALTERRSEKAKAIRREMRKQGKDWSPRREKELVARTDGVMGALVSSRNFENILTDFTSIRRLTPLECERLQGFPDGWTEGVSDTQRYKCLGNAVTVNVVEFIVSKLSC